MDFIYVGVLFAVAVFSFYMAHHISLVKVFVVSEEKSKKLGYLMYLCLVFGLFEVYVGASALFYYLELLDKTVVLRILNPVAIIVFFVSSMILLKFGNPSRSIRNLGLLLATIAIFASISISFSQIYSIGLIIYIAFLILVTASVVASLFKKLLMETMKLMGDDPIERARGVGAFISVVGVSIAAIFFLLNRLGGELFGPLAILTQVFMLLALYGIYINLNPPNYLIKLIGGEV